MYRCNKCTKNIAKNPYTKVDDIVCLPCLEAILSKYQAENERLKNMVEALEAEVKLLRKIRADELEAEEN